MRLVLAPNPGPMTGPGTNQYLLGGRTPVLVDAAPYDAENACRIEAGLAGRRLGAILVTHGHLDHMGGATALRTASGAGVAVHESRGGSTWAGAPLAPERLLGDGDEIVHDGGRLRAVYTPGHDPGHLCFYDPDRRWLFTGDLILGTGTTVVAPPDGDMVAYLDSLRRLRAFDLERILPGHGPAVECPHEKIAEYLEHRAMRERQIVEALAAGVGDVAAMVRRIYVDVHPALHGMAGLMVRAHLAKLAAEGEVVEEPEGHFRRVD